MQNKINRFERKWIYKSNNYLNLVCNLLKSDFFFKNQYPKRRVNSIYFDSIKYTSARENLDGSNKKLKIRIRWYGNEQIILRPYLEIKKKVGFITTKSVIELKSINELNFRHQKTSAILRKTVNDIVKCSNELIPTSTTHYQREYFISNNQKVRATVDYNLKSVFLKNNSQLDIIRNYSNKSILELKYSPIYDEYVRKNLYRITLRLSKNSKFIGSLMERPNYIF